MKTKGCCMYKVLPFRRALLAVLWFLVVFHVLSTFHSFVPYRVSHHPSCFHCINSSPVYLSMSNLTVPPQALRQVDHQAPNQVPNRRVFLVRSHHHSRLVCPPFSGHSITTMEARLLWRTPPIVLLVPTSKMVSPWPILPVSILEIQSSPCPISL